MSTSRKALFVGVGIFAAIGAIAALAFPGDGLYPLTVVQMGNKFSMPDKPDPAPYIVNETNGHIEWTITNNTDTDPIRIQLDNFSCDAGPFQCPLQLTPRGTIDCTSDVVSIPKGTSKTITGDVNAGSKCSSGWYWPDIWEYRFTINGLPLDPELEIDRGYRPRVVGRIRRFLGWIRRLAHF